ncbi:MAG: hypothetical protein K1X64_11320 [Myxococcaceae bacterium]|nr:hypothetical protein [Myxococcaceae bacterium]
MLSRYRFSPRAFVVGVALVVAVTGCGPDFPSGAGSNKRPSTGTGGGSSSGTGGNSSSGTGGGSSSGSGGGSQAQEECHGLATSCSIFSKVSCYTQDGCYSTSSSSYCSGFARSCSSFSSRSSCNSQDGCYWD